MLSLCRADFDFQKGFLTEVFGYCPVCFSWLLAILRGPHYEELSYDNARTPSWINLY